MIGNPFSGQKLPNKPGGFSSNYTSDWSLPKNPWLEQTQPETQAAPEYSDQGGEQNTTTGGVNNPNDGLYNVLPPNTAIPAGSGVSNDPPMQSHVWSSKPSTASGLMDQIFKRMVDPSAPGSLIDHTMPVRSSGGGGIFSSFLAPFKGSIKDLIGSAGIGAGSPIGGTSSLLDPNRFSNWEKDHPNEPLLARLDGGPVPPRMSEDEFNQQNGITPEMAARLKQMMSDGSVQF